MKVEKRCPRCRHRFDVNTKSKNATCPSCGITYDVYHPKTEYEIANNKGGIALRYVPPKKKCSCCNETKPITQFKKYSHSSDLHSSWCKKCTSKQNKLNYQNNKKHKTVCVKDIPEVNAKAPLSSVLNHLIRISSNGYHADEILNDSLAKIKETISETSSASN
jgi:predicted  nucleic acid-binding Zn-ribbon protein